MPDAARDGRDRSAGARQHVRRARASRRVRQPGPHQVAGQGGDQGGVAAGQVAGIARALRGRAARPASRRHDRCGAWAAPSRTGQSPRGAVPKDSASDRACRRTGPRTAPGADRDRSGGSAARLGPCRRRRGWPVRGVQMGHQAQIGPARNMRSARVCTGPHDVARAQEQDKIAAFLPARDRGRAGAASRLHQCARFVVVRRSALRRWRRRRRSPAPRAPTMQRAERVQRGAQIARAVQGMTTDRAGGLSVRGRACAPRHRPSRDRGRTLFVGTGPYSGHIARGGQGAQHSAAFEDQLSLRCGRRPRLHGLSFAPMMPRSRAARRIAGRCGHRPGR